MGFKTFRTSINWTRIFPTGMETEPNEKGLEFYDKVFDCCKKHGIEPLVTISHYELPYALVEKYNGWASRELIEFYMNYCKAIFERYKDKVKYWLTFNEINCGTMPMGAILETGTIRGFEGPTDKVPDNKQERFQALHHQFVASAEAVRYAHDHYPQFKMGCMICFITSYGTDLPTRPSRLRQTRRPCRSATGSALICMSAASTPVPKLNASYFRRRITSPIRQDDRTVVRVGHVR